jgi:transcriptional regulator with XRE-family HTH domain
MKMLHEMRVAASGLCNVEPPAVKRIHPRQRTRDPRAASATDRYMGLRLRARRMEMGLSQQALAAAIGVTFQQIQKYELGVNRMPASKLLEIAKALSVSPSLFFPEDDIEQTEPGFEDPYPQKLLSAMLRLNARGRHVVLIAARALAADSEFSAARGKY